MKGRGPRGMHRPASLCGSEVVTGVENTVDVALDSRFDDVAYSVTATASIADPADGNVGVSVINKTVTGFTLRPDVPFTGSIDWRAERA